MWRLIMADHERKKVYRCLCRDCKSRRSEAIRKYHRCINQVMLELDERSRRLFAGLLARQFGRGGIQHISVITGFSRVTIRRGLRECEQSQPSESDRVRREGGGRKSVEKK